MFIGMAQGLDHSWRGRSARDDAGSCNARIRVGVDTRAWNDGRN